MSDQHTLAAKDHINHDRPGQLMTESGGKSMTPPPFQMKSSTSELEDDQGGTTQLKLTGGPDKGAANADAPSGNGKTGIFQLKGGPLQMKPDVDPEVQEELRQKFEVYCAHKLETLEKGATPGNLDQAAEKAEFLKKKERFLKQMNGRKHLFWGTKRYDRLMARWFGDYEQVLSAKVSAVKNEVGEKIVETNQTIDGIVSTLQNAIAVASTDSASAQNLLGQAAEKVAQATGQKEAAEKTLTEYGPDAKATILPAYDAALNSYTTLIQTLQANIDGIAADSAHFQTVIAQLGTQKSALTKFNAEIGAQTDVLLIIGMQQKQFATLNSQVNEVIEMANGTTRQTEAVAEDAITNEMNSSAAAVAQADQNVAEVKATEIARREEEARKKAAEEARKKKEAEEARKKKAAAEKARQDALAKKSKSKGASSNTKQSTGKTSEKRPDYIKSHLEDREGRLKDHQKVYKDSLGKLTVGVGHLLTKAQKKQYKEGDIVPLATLKKWFETDSQSAYDRAKEQMQEIGFENQDLLDALTYMVFQNGKYWNTKHKQTWKKLKAKQWEAAALEAGDSKWFQQTPKRVLDFQALLLGIAGKPNDFDSLKTFNAANIKKWNPPRYPKRLNLPKSHADNSKGADKAGKTSEKAGFDWSSLLPKETPSRKINALAQQYQADEIDAIACGKGLLKYGTGHGATIKAAIEKHIGWNYQDNVTYVMANYTDDAGLAKLDAVLLKFMAYTLDPENNSSSVAKKKVQYKRINAVLGTGTTTKTDKADKSGADEDVKKSGNTKNANVKIGDIPKKFKDRYTINGSVGRTMKNAPENVKKIDSLLNMVGYDLEVREIKNKSYKKTKAQRKLILRANSIFNFQKIHGLSGDGNIGSIEGETWKRLVEVAYANFGDNQVDDAGIDKVHKQRLGKPGDVPNDLKADCTNGHLLGIDNSGFLLPEEFRPGARKLKKALARIKQEIGSFEISCGYRAPEHNVKIGSTASMSQHCYGIAADIQIKGTGLTVSQLWSKINKLRENGEIPTGWLSKKTAYSWGCHYDVRG